MSLASDCTSDLEAKLRKTQKFGDAGKKVLHIYSEEDLLTKIKAMQLPAVGVLYEGISNQGGQNEGLNGSLKVALILVLDSNAYPSIDKKNEIAEILDSMRAAIRMTTSPSKHKWRFMAEIPVGVIGSHVIFVQRWSTFVPLTN